MKTIADIRNHNLPLRRKLELEGCQLLTNTHACTTNFVNAAGEYVPYPTGYITCAPAHISVRLKNGTWAQRTFAQFGTAAKAYEWALETAGKEVA